MSAYGGRLVGLVQSPPENLPAPGVGKQHRCFRVPIYFILPQVIECMPSPIGRLKAHLQLRFFNLAHSHACPVNVRVVRPGKLSPWADWSVFLLSRLGVSRSLTLLGWDGGGCKGSGSCRGRRLSRAFAEGEEDKALRGLQILWIPLFVRHCL